jgi:hypothetical protein
MLKDIIGVQPTQDYRLHLRLEGWVEGEVDITGMVWFEGVFAPLKKPKRSDDDLCKLAMEFGCSSLYIAGVKAALHR